MENNFLLDTNILIDALRGYKPAVSFVESFSEIYVSVITVSELIYGCRNKTELNKIVKLVSYYNIIHIDENISETALTLYEEHFLEKNLVFDDALIGATAIFKDLTLVTRNIKHFSNIEKLALEIPY